MSDNVGETKLVYMKQETCDSMFQTCLRFTVPLPASTNIQNDIIRVGYKCFSVWEAETEVDAAALQVFESVEFVVVN